MTIQISPLGIWLFGFFTGIAAVAAVMSYLSYRLNRMKQIAEADRFAQWLEEQGPELASAIEEVVKHGAESQ